MATRATKWEKFKEQMKQKRKGRNVQKDSEEEIVVQRLSASVSGKAQKYTGIGPREFVELGDHELTIDNIKTACVKHFSPKIDMNMVCYVLAGQQGPSCTNVKQRPNRKLIHVQFIEDESDNVEMKCEDNQEQQPRLKSKHHSESSSSRQPFSLPSSVKKE